MRIKCKCGAKIVIPDEKAGERCRCNNCGSMFRVQKSRRSNSATRQVSPRSDGGNPVTSDQTRIATNSGSVTNEDVQEEATTTRSRFRLAIIGACILVFILTLLMNFVLRTNDETAPTDSPIAKSNAQTPTAPGSPKDLTSDLDTESNKSDKPASSGFVVNDELSRQFLQNKEFRRKNTERAEKFIEEIRSSSADDGAFRTFVDFVHRQQGFLRPQVQNVAEGPARWTSLDFSADEKFLAYGGMDEIISIWKLESPEDRKTIALTPRVFDGNRWYLGVRSLAFSPQGQNFVVTNFDLSKRRVQAAPNRFINVDVAQPVLEIRDAESTNVVQRCRIPDSNTSNRIGHYAFRDEERIVSDFGDYSISQNRFLNRGYGRGVSHLLPLDGDANVFLQYQRSLKYSYAGTLSVLDGHIDTGITFRAANSARKINQRNGGAYCIDLSPDRNTLVCGMFNEGGLLVTVNIPDDLAIDVPLSLSGVPITLDADIFKPYSISIDCTGELAAISWRSKYIGNYVVIAEVSTGSIRQVLKHSHDVGEVKFSARSRKLAVELSPARIDRDVTKTAKPATTIQESQGVVPRVQPPVPYFVDEPNLVRVWQWNREPDPFATEMENEFIADLQRGEEIELNRRRLQAEIRAQRQKELAEKQARHRAMFGRTVDIYLQGGGSKNLIDAAIAPVDSAGYEFYDQNGRPFFPIRRIESGGLTSGSALSFQLPDEVSAVTLRHTDWDDFSATFSVSSVQWHESLGQEFGVILITNENL